MISNCSHDENGRYSGGAAGDQTGQEWTIRTWYDRPWTVVLRHPKMKVRKSIARKAKNGAKNNYIGYDQGGRLSFYNELKKTNWVVKKIKTKCEADCSASTCAIVIAAGHKCGVKKLQKISPSLTTSYIKKEFVEAGFKALTDKKYLKSEKYLKPGDILLYEGHHVAIKI